MNTFAKPDRRKTVEYNPNQMRGLTTVLTCMLLLFTFTAGALAGVLVTISHQKHSRREVVRQIHNMKHYNNKGEWNE